MSFPADRKEAEPDCLARPCDGHYQRQDGRTAGGT